MYSNFQLIRVERLKVLWRVSGGLKEKVGVFTGKLGKRCVVTNSRVLWEFHCFNQALLCKQAWRLLEFPNSLIARIFKARYFPDSDLIAADVGNYPSYTWRSIIWGRELLDHGLQWRIGDGKQVRIYTDAWVPHARCFCVRWNPVLSIDTKRKSL